MPSKKYFQFERQGELWSQSTIWCY